MVAVHLHSAHRNRDKKILRARTPQERGRTGDRWEEPRLCSRPLKLCAARTGKSFWEDVVGSGEQSTDNETATTAKHRKAAELIDRRW